MSEVVILKLIDAGGTLFAVFLFIGLLRGTGVGLVQYLREYTSARRDGSQILVQSLHELCDTIQASAQLLADIYRQSPGFDRRKHPHDETSTQTGKT